MGREMDRSQLASKGGDPHDAGAQRVGGHRGPGESRLELPFLVKDLGAETTSIALHLIEDLLHSLSLLDAHGELPHRNGVEDVPRTRVAVQLSGSSQAHAGPCLELQNFALAEA